VIFFLGREADMPELNDELRNGELMRPTDIVIKPTQTNPKRTELDPKTLRAVACSLEKRAKELLAKRDQELDAATRFSLSETAHELIVLGQNYITKARPNT
jgi:hypothetical protein